MKKVRAHPTVRFTFRTLRFVKSHCMDGKNFSLKLAEGLGGENLKIIPAPFLLPQALFPLKTMGYVDMLSMGM